MLRVFLIFILASGSALAQTAPAQPPVTTPATSATQKFHPENVGPDTVVIEIQGVCSPSGDGTVTQSPCVTRITKSQFNAMLASLDTSSPMTTAAAQRSFAESYIQLLGLAGAAEKSGIDKDPQFIELMKIVRVRTLAETYRRLLESKANNPSPEELQAFYQKNGAKYEQIKAERVIIPNVRRTPNDAQKAKDLANQIHDRAVKGEDMAVLQADAYKALGLPNPPATDLGARRRGTLPSTIEEQLFSMKPGEVTKVELEPSGFTIYRLRSHDQPSIDSIRTELLRDVRQQYVSSSIKSVQDNIRTNLNLDYFTPHQGTVGPVPTRPRGMPGAGTAAPAPTPSSTATPKQ